MPQNRSPLITLDFPKVLGGASSALLHYKYRTFFSFIQILGEFFQFRYRTHMDLANSLV